MSLKIIITPENNLDEETTIVEALLNAGLKHLHIRKPNFSREEMKRYLENISPQYRPCLVLHQHHDLAEEMGIERLHFTEKMRFSLSSPLRKELRYSTSVHSAKDFNLLDEVWEYAFISPVFPSISKMGYGENSNLLDDLTQRKNTKTKMIALGGITTKNQHIALQHGADGIALLGAIWQNPNPLTAWQNFT